MGGFFGAVSRKSCVSDIFFGTDFHSHLGTVRGGMAITSENRFHRAIHDISNTQFRSKFDHDFQAFNRLGARAGIGIISDHDDQPLLIASHLGMYAIVAVGVLINLDELVAELYQREGGTHLSELGGGAINPTEVVASLINTQDSFEEGIQYAQSRIVGSCSLIILTLDGRLYAARDRYGRTPIALGEKNDGYAVATESCSFPNTGYRLVRDLGCGEVVELTADGVETVVPPAPGPGAICAFLWVYFAYPASTIDGRNVEQTRYRCGQYLASHQPVDADFVAGVPDSGVGHALGYAAASGIYYARPFVKYTPTWPRSFMPTDQSVRDQIAQMKLIPIPELINGKRMIFCDDSIVRGTQLRDQVNRLNAAGAKEIHMRIACPPLLYKCRFINFSRTRSSMDLAGRRVIQEIEGPDADIARYQDPDDRPYKTMVEKIRFRLGLTTLSYQRIDDLKKAIGVPGICTYCWTGQDVSLDESCAAGCVSCSKVSCAVKSV